MDSNSSSGQQLSGSQNGETASGAAAASSVGTMTVWRMSQNDTWERITLPRDAAGTTSSNEEQQARSPKEYITVLGPHDICCGRGTTINENPGNVTFREIVAKVKAEYSSTKSRREKSRIAEELVRSIRTTLNPPGRFLERVDDPMELERAGIPPNVIDVWVECDDCVALEKTKQALRRGAAAAAATTTTASPTSSSPAGMNSAEQEETAMTSASGMETNNKKKRDLACAAESIKTAAVETTSRLSESSSLAKLAQTFPNNHELHISNAASAAAAAAAAVPAEEAAIPTIFTASTVGGEHQTQPFVQQSGGGMLHQFPADSQQVNMMNVQQDLNGSERGLPNFDQQLLQNAYINHEAKTAAADSDARAHLLSNVNVALSVVRTMAEAHRAATESDESKIQADLKSLGILLFQLFTSVAAPTDSRAYMYEVEVVTPISIGDGQQDRQSKRADFVSTQPTASDILHDAGLPNSIYTLLMSLLHATDPSATDRYISSDDVEADLMRMVSNPDQYLFDPPSRYAGNLDFSSDRLYGRDQEYDRMTSCFDSVILRQVERRGVVLVTGPAGSGKTSLAVKLRGPLAERRGMMLSVKFDSQGSEQPISKMFRSIEEYCQRLLQGDATLLVKVGLAIRQALGPEVAVLKDLIPSLGIVIGGWGSTHFDMEQNETYNLILHCFCKVIRAISGPTHPIIWLLDDLQWSDAASLEMITNLVTDEETRSVLFIGCFRDDEVTEDHVLNRALGDITMAASYSKTISLGNLNRGNVNELLSDAMHLPPRLTRPLASLALIKTRGNPMFVRQLIRSLCDEGLLQYSARSRRWIWDIDAINAKNVADNTVDFIINMMQTYGTDVQWVLRTAACLGSSFDAATIKRTYSGLASSSSGDDGSDVFGHISALISDGLMTKKGSTYRFSHDQIWQAAYALTPSSERKAMHLQIGRHLLQIVPKDELDVFIFTIVDQLNRGIDIITDHTDQLEIAELNLRAGEKALLASSFLQASIYLLQGSVLIKPEDWQSRHYDLCLQLYTACGEVQYAQGNYASAIISLNPVLTNGKSLDDKLRAYYTLIITKAAQMNFRESIQHALFVLEQLGESFPDTADESVMEKVLDSTQTMIGSTRVEEILSTHTTCDKRKIASLRILIGASRSAYVANPMLMFLFVLRMVDIAMVDGLTPESSHAFAYLSFLLCNLGNHEMSAYCAKVATSLLSKFDQKYSSRVIMLLNMSILPYQQPLHSCLASIRQAHKDACSLGDQFGGRMSVNQIAPLSILLAPERGKTLKDIENELRQIIQGVTSMQEGQSNNLILTHMYLQMLLNLKSMPLADDLGDPTKLSGEALNQDEFLGLCREQQMGDYFRKFYSCRMCIAYMFRRYDLAADMLEEVRKIASSSRFCLTLDNILETFYGGLVAATIHSQPNVSNEDRSKWRILATDSLKKLKGFAEESEWNFRHKYDLLRAEIVAVDGEKEAAANAYDNAIRGASEHCFINEQSLACERAGLFYLGHGNMSKAKEYLTKAEMLYRVWGAERKSADLSHLLKQRCSN